MFLIARSFCYPRVIQLTRCSRAWVGDKKHALPYHEHETAELVLSVIAYVKGMDIYIIAYAPQMGGERAEVT